MQKKFYIVLTVLLTMLLAVSTVHAGGVSIKLSTSLGSLVGNVTATGLGSTDYIFEIEAKGDASVVCTNYGGNQAPGQNYPHTEGKSSKGLQPSEISRNGKAVFTMETFPDLELNPNISWQEGGCPNSNWSAKVNFVYYKTVIVTAYVNSGGGMRGAMVAQNIYSCVTTRTGPNSTPSTFDDGTVSCTRIG